MRKVTKSPLWLQRLQEDTRMSGLIREIDPKLGALAMSGETPNPWAYAPLERAMQDAAARHHAAGLLGDVLPEGLSPTAAEQASVWVGPEEAQSADELFDHLLHESAAKWGLSPDEANRRVWQNRQPFLLPLVAPLLGNVNR